MKAGRELDALIFQYVLGYSDPVEVCCGAAYKKAPESAWFKIFKEPPKGAVFKSYFGYGLDRFTTRSGEGIYCAKPFKPYIPDFYSTNISHAFEVVEKLWHPVLEHYDGQWHFRYTDCEKGVFEATADTAPLAICLAALKAVGVEVADEE